MLQKTILKTICIAALGAGFVLPSFAQVDVTGRVRAYFQQESKKKGKDGEAVSMMDIASDGRVEIIGTNEGDNWTSSFKIGSAVNTAGAVIYNRDRWVKVENDGMSIRLGRAWYLDNAFRVAPGFTGPGYKYILGTSDNGAPYGRFDGVEYSLKGVDNLSLVAVLGLNNTQKQLINGPTPSGTVTTTGSDGWQTSKPASAADAAEFEATGTETIFGLSANYSLGDIGLGFTFASSSFAGDKKQTPNSDETKVSGTTIDLSAGYTGIENLGLGLNIRNKTEKSTIRTLNADGTVASTADVDKTGKGATVVELVANYAIGGGNVHFAFSNHTQDIEETTGIEKLKENAITLGYNTTIGGAASLGQGSAMNTMVPGNGAILFANYYSQAITGGNTNGSDEETNSWIAIGLQHSY